MCGIAGLVDPAVPAAPMRRIVSLMTDTLVHRGPDDEGSYVADGVGLGMRRLSIIDVAGGQQPIANEDGSIQVVFNGEIYNYLELRKELSRRGQVRTPKSSRTCTKKRVSRPSPTCAACSPSRCGIGGPAVSC
jgi:asparagine synthase (glutamine-hydrolysing)